MLKIQHLTVKAQSKQVLSDLSLEINPGEIHVLLGPNGAGKSSLAKVIAGHPRYQVVAGSITFSDQDITSLSPEERVKLGLAVTVQNPPEIKGVKLVELLDLIKRNLADSQSQTGSVSSQKSQSQKSAQPKVTSYLQELNGVTQQLLDRELNVRFSGGEKKLAEVLQLISLEPKLAVLDEIDSGLDLKNLERILKVLKQEIISRRIPVLLITHHGQIVDGLQPDWTHVMIDRKIICHSQDYQKVIATIKQHGYEKCRHCQSVDRR